MKKSVLLGLFFSLFTVAVFAQDDDAGIEELDAPPSLDELLEKPKPIKYESFDGFVDASFKLYDRVIEVRKDGEANGWPAQGIKVNKFFKEYAMLVKETVEMAQGIKAMPKLKIPFALKNFIIAKKAISHSNAHIKYMKSQFTPEEWAKIEAASDAGLEDWQTEEAPAEEAGDGEGDGGGK